MLSVENLLKKSGLLVVGSFGVAMMAVILLLGRPEMLTAQGDKVMPAKLDRIKNPAPLDKMAPKEFKTATFALG